MSAAASSNTVFSLPDHLSPSDQLCYVHCNFCDTVLAVVLLPSCPSSLSLSRSLEQNFIEELFDWITQFSFLHPFIFSLFNCVQLINLWVLMRYVYLLVFDVQVSVPCSSLFKTVTVRCGHCSNLLSVNMRGLILPAAANQLHLGHSFFTPQNLLVSLLSSYRLYQWARNILLILVLTHFLIPHGIGISQLVGQFLYAGIVYNCRFRFVCVCYILYTNDVLIECAYMQQEEIRNAPSNIFTNQPNMMMNESFMPMMIRGGVEEIPKPPPVVNRRKRLTSQSSL